MRVLGVTLVALLAAGCTAVGTPPPVAGDLSDVQAALALRGATIHQVVAGDTGCPGSPLHSNGVRIDLTLEGDENPYTVYLFRWRRAEQFAAGAQPFEACVDEFVAGAEGDLPIDGVEVEPWRAYGPAWSDELVTTIESGLRAAARGR